MSRADDDHQLVAGHRRADEAVGRDRAFDETKLHRSVLNSGGYLRRIADFQLDRDVRVALMETNQMPGKPVAGDRLARLHAQPAPFQRAEIAERQICGVNLRQDTARLGQQDAAGLGQLDTAAHPVEQLGLVARLQRRDRMADGGLRQIQRLRGLRHVLAFGDSHKDAKLIECHCRLAPSALVPLSIKTDVIEIGSKNIYWMD